MANMHKLDDYFTLSYRMEIVEDKDEGGYVVSFPKLPGCITCGETLESAIVNALEAALEDGYTINFPSEEQSSK